MLTRSDFDSDSLSSFPLLIEVMGTKQRMKVDTVEDIPSDKEIKVLQINYMEGSINVTSN